MIPIPRSSFGILLLVFGLTGGAAFAQQRKAPADWLTLLSNGKYDKAAAALKVKIDQISPRTKPSYKKYLEGLVHSIEQHCKECAESSKFLLFRGIAPDRTDFNFGTKSRPWYPSRGLRDWSGMPVPDRITAPDAFKLRNAKAHSASSRLAPQSLFISSSYLAALAEGSSPAVIVMKICPQRFYVPATSLDEREVLIDAFIDTNEILAIVDRDPSGDLDIEYGKFVIRYNGAEGVDDAGLRKLLIQGARANYKFSQKPGSFVLNLWDEILIRTEPVLAPYLLEPENKIPRLTGGDEAILKDIVRYGGDGHRRNLELIADFVLDKPKFGADPELMEMLVDEALQEERNFNLLITLGETALSKKKWLSLPQYPRWIEKILRANLRKSSHFFEDVLANPKVPVTPELFRVLRETVSIGDNAKNVVKFVLTRPELRSEPLAVQLFKAVVASKKLPKAALAQLTLIWDTQPATKTTSRLPCVTKTLGL